MPLIEINKDPSRRELNWFGLIFALFFALAGALLFWRFSARAAAAAIWFAAAAITAAYYLLPATRRRIYLTWMYTAFPVGWLISHLLMALIFYLVFLPIALIMRLLGHDPLHRRFEKDATSYWVERHPAEDSARYFRQF